MNANQEQVTGLHEMAGGICLWGAGRYGVNREGNSTILLTDPFNPFTSSERYHVEMLVGAATEFVRVATVYDANANLSGLTPGAIVKVRVIAANAGGESVPSAVVEATVPALALAA